MWRKRRGAAPLLALGDWYAHPILFAAIVWFLFRRGREVPRNTSRVVRWIASDAARLWITSAPMLAFYFAVYLFTPSEVKWQLDTSADRLLLQILPCLLISVLVCAAPETAGIRMAKPPAAARTHSPRKARQKTA